MPELPDDAYSEVRELCAAGDEFAERGEWQSAIARFRSAFDRLPEPKLEWSAALWILAAIGDVEFQRGDFPAARKALMSAMTHFDEARANPFLRLRLGQSMYELGEHQEAMNWLLGAFALEGAGLFADDDPKYLEFIKSRMQPPPGGWGDDPA